MVSGYGQELTSRFGRQSRALAEEHGPAYFGVSVSKRSHSATRWDIEGREGGLFATGVGGVMTGLGANDLIIDDPVKNFQEAHSEVSREAVWDWFTSTAYTRLAPKANIFIIQTRWHEDDLSGRILARCAHEGWEVLKFPAIAEEHDVLGRKPGDALWPERYPIGSPGEPGTLSAIRQTLGEYQFSALYQQSPMPPGGLMFQRNWFEIVDAVPSGCERCRAWDKAGTEGGGDWTAGVLMARSPDSVFYIDDVARGQWSSLMREQAIANTAAQDKARPGKRYMVHLEQEPGSGGKHSAEVTTRALAGYEVSSDRATGDKVSRARPFAAQAEAGNVKLVRGPWNEAFLNEIQVFPAGAHDDQVDAASDAFRVLALAPKKFAAWVG
jgi:predicted phage terminase large subunit-like protein